MKFLLKAKTVLNWRKNDYEADIIWNKLSEINNNIAKTLKSIILYSKNEVIILKYLFK